MTVNSEQWLQLIDLHVDHIVNEYKSLSRHLESIDTVTDAETCDLDVVKAAMVIKLKKLEKKIEAALE